MADPLAGTRSWNRREFLGIAAACTAHCLGSRNAWAQKGEIFYNCVQAEPWYLAAQQGGGAAKRSAALLESVTTIAREAADAAVPADSVLKVDGAPAPALESVGSELQNRALKLIRRAQQNLGKPPQSNLLESVGISDLKDVAQLEGVFEREKRWRRPVVKIQFLQVPALVRKTVMQAAEQWGQHCCTQFRETSGVGEIRVSFDPSLGHCSLIGVDSINNSVSARGASFNINPNDGAFQRDPRHLLIIALHEFGHAVGLHHEHQNVRGKFRWNESVVRQVLAGQNWSEEMIQQNVFRRISDSRVFELTKFDPESIMIYPWPTGATTGADRPPTDWNRRISPTDEAVVRKMYGCKAPEKVAPGQRDRVEKVVVKTDPRKALKSADAKLVEINVVTAVTFKTDRDLMLYRFQVPRKDSSRDAIDEFVVESVDGALDESDRDQATPVVIELFTDSGDFSAARSAEVSHLGVSASADDLGSIGVSDAYLRRALPAETTVYLLVRPLGRFSAGDPARQCHLLVRRTGIARPNGIDGRSFAGILRSGKPQVP